MTVNKVILVGNVGRDPEVNYIREDVPVARFPLATSESYTRDGEKVTNTEWHNIVAWRGLAKVVEKYVRKGKLLYIEGKITTRSYEKEGDTKYFTEIVADSLRMLDRKGDDQYQQVVPQPSVRNAQSSADAPLTNTVTDGDKITPRPIMDEGGSKYSESVSDNLRMPDRKGGDQNHQVVPPPSSRNAQPPPDAPAADNAPDDDLPF